MTEVLIFWTKEGKVIYKLVVKIKMAIFQLGRSLTRLLAIGARREEKTQRNSFKNGRKTNIESKPPRLKFLRSVSTFWYSKANLG